MRCLKILFYIERVIVYYAGDVSRSRICAAEKKRKEEKKAAEAMKGLWKYERERKSERTLCQF